MQSVIGRQRDLFERDKVSLVAVLRETPLAAVWEPDDLQQLLQAAELHGIVIPLYRAFLSGNLLASDATALTDMARRRRAGALQISTSALNVCEWLQNEGVRHAILKGPAVAAAYPEADREFGDLDLLIAPGQMSRAIATIEKHGGERRSDVSWPRPDGIEEISLFLPGGVDVDLHAELLVHSRDRADFRLPTGQLLLRATSECVLGSELPVLDPVDTLIHVALHAVISGGDRLVWLSDLDALVRRRPVSWPTLLSRSRDARAALVVGVMLDRATMVLGTPVPRDVLRSLEIRGVVWAFLLRMFEKWRPTAANYDRSFHGQILMRSTRDSTCTSLATLFSLIRTDVLKHVLQDPQHPWRRRIHNMWRRG
jgi:hypothetical protein